jgi:guanylate kinase
VETVLWEVATNRSIAMNKQNKKHTVFLIVGQTASGKDSLVNAMCNEFKVFKKDILGNIATENYKKLTSYTTRPRRINEGNTYTFISKSEVEPYRNDMVAYTQIGEYEYFATKEQLRNCDFYIIDYQGIEYLRTKQLDDEFRFVTIYINTSDTLRRQRALAVRKDIEEVFNKRNKDECYQFANMRMKSDFDYSINNVDFNKSLKVLKHIVEVELENENNS